MSFYRYAYEIYENSESIQYHRSNAPISFEAIVPHNPFTYRYYTSQSDNTSNNTCYVVSVGYERRPPQGTQHRIRSYNRYSFHYFIKGQGEYKGESISAGQMLIIPPFEELYFVSDPSNPLEFYYISVSGEGSEAVFDNTGFQLTPYLCECPFITQIPQLFYSPLFEKHSDTDPSFYLMGFYLQLMGYHKKHNSTESEEKKGTTYYYYSQAISYIEAYLLSNITPKDVADFLNISYSYLRKIFSMYSDCSVKEYILKQRFIYAANKLALTQCSVQEAANIIGYSDHVHFSKMFKKIMGCSPGHYRDTYKETNMASQ